MTPVIFRSFADRFHKFRWHFLFASLLCFGAVAILIATTSEIAQPVSWLVGFSFSLLVPLGLVSWGLLCACTWFHPIKGKLETSVGILGRIPAWLQSAIRWYAAIFLNMFLFVALILWPFQSLKLFL